MPASLKVTKLFGNTFSFSTSGQSLDLDSGLESLYKKVRQDVDNGDVTIEVEEPTKAPAPPPFGPRTFKP